MSSTWALDTIYAIDSAEMVIAAHTLGIDHPPGHPLYLLFAHLFSRLPFARMDQAVIFTSVFFGALASYLLARCLYEYTRHFFAALVTGWLFAFCRIFWIHATLAEVYTIQLTFLGLFLTLTARWLRESNLPSFFLLVFSLGLAATTNILLVVLLIPAFVYVTIRSGIFLTQGHWQGKTCLKSLFYGLLGLSPFLYIPLRLNQESSFISDFVYLNGYEVQSFRWYWWYLSAEEFTTTKILDTPFTRYPALLISYLESFVQNAGAPTVALTLAGVLAIPITRLRSAAQPANPTRKERRQQATRQRRNAQIPETIWNRLVLPKDKRHVLFETTVLLSFFCTLFPVISYQVPDKDVFFMPSFFFLMALSGLGVHRLLRMLSQWKQKWSKFLSPLALAFPLYLLFTHYPEIVKINADTSVYENRLKRFQALPPNALIIGEDDGHATRYKYFSMVLGLRPDVTVHTLGRLAPRFVNEQSIVLGQNITLSLNVADRLRILQSLLSENPDRPLFAILDDRMPPEFDHFRTRRSSFDPYLLRVEPKPPSETSSEALPVVVAVKNVYYNTFRFTGFQIEGLDGNASRTFPTPIPFSGRTIDGIVQRSELFELAFVVHKTAPNTAKIFAEFAFINDRMEIPTAHGFTAAKQVEILPETLPEQTFLKDQFTFKIPQFIPQGFYTLAVRASQTTEQIQGTYQGKPIRSLVPLKARDSWQGQREYQPLGLLWVQ
ncbi:MAG: DUF2723 domain-containing protein [bacterium]|nr:DUF2723 domain-containing protein [bacterium]